MNRERAEIDMNVFTIFCSQISCDCHKRDDDTVTKTMMENHQNVLKFDYLRALLCFGSKKFKFASLIIYLKNRKP